MENAVGKVARVGIKQGEVISAKDVLSESENLIGFLPVNFRAMTIIVRQNPGEANLYRLGQMVDILVTLKDGARLVTRTILQNVRILYKHPPKLDMEKGPQDISYTFAVSPKDAEKLALAQKEGTLQIVVRSQSDTQTNTMEGTSSEQIFGRKGSAMLSNLNEAATNGEQEEGPTMEVIRGTESEVKTFKPEPPPPYEYGETSAENGAAENIESAPAEESVNSSQEPSTDSSAPTEQPVGQEQGQ
jgi:pilus assembly protein CpaB